MRLICSVQAVTAVADIESPADIVSHRVSIALLEFDAKYTFYQNGTLTETEGIFSNIVCSNLSTIFSHLQT